MADVKISALPASTTPLAGTEVLPIVQSGTTVQVSVANLTAGRAIGATNATFTGALSVTPTWNAGATVFTGIGLNVTDTASAAGSLLLDLQVGGSSMLSVRKNGLLTTRDVISAADNTYSLGSSSVYWGGLFSTNAVVKDSGSFTWHSGDLSLRRDAANTLAQRNGVNAQAFRVYNTFTDASNYERGSVGWSSNNFRIIVENAGTGIGRKLQFGVAGSAQWEIDGNLLAVTDNTRDIGASGANRPRDLYIGRDIIAQSNTGGYYLGASGDVFLTRDAANTLAMRRTTNAQTFNLYNTYTDASNYERGSVGWSANVFTISAENAGTGGNRGLSIIGKNTTIIESTLASVFFRTNSANRWSIASDGHFTAAVDNTLDIGASGANRPRNLFVAGRATIGTLTIGLGGNTSVASNTALGVTALNSASLTGVQNTGVGNLALQSNTTGTNHTATGNRSLRDNTTGISNSAFGSDALVFNTTGSQNSALGVAALQSNTTASNNCAVGAESLFYYNTSNNTAVGYQAARGSTTVANNTGTSLTAVGYKALLSNTSGLNNSALGYQSLYSNTTGNYNSATGTFALFANTTGSDNSATGFNALNSNTTGYYNNAFAALALQQNTTGAENNAFGRNSLGATTTGNTNVAFGDNAGDVITTGSRNTIIGGGSDPSANNGIDQTVVGQGLTGKGDDTAFIGGTNGAYNEKNVTTWETTSDQRIKKNIVSNALGLEVISQIDVRNFEYRTAEEITDLPASAAINQSGTQLGVIAQELQAILPECVTENSTGVLSVNTDPLIWYLINAVKQLSAEIQTLKGA